MVWFVVSFAFSEPDQTKPNCPFLVFGVLDWVVGVLDWVFGVLGWVVASWGLGLTVGCLD